jgi:hypothetical protein
LAAETLAFDRQRRQNNSQEQRARTAANIEKQSTSYGAESLPPTLLSPGVVPASRCNAIRAPPRPREAAGRITITCLSTPVSRNNSIIEIINEYL